MYILAYSGLLYIYLNKFSSMIISGISIVRSLISFSLSVLCFLHSIYICSSVFGLLQSLHISNCLIILYFSKNSVVGSILCIYLYIIVLFLVCLACFSEGSQMTFFIILIYFYYYFFCICCPAVSGALILVGMRNGTLYVDKLNQTIRLINI